MADASRLRQLLLKDLPNYMVPSMFVRLPSLPLTPNGKVDQRALPAPEREGAVGAYAAPQSALERELASIWSDVLAVDAVSVDANFFDLGGNSFHLVEVLVRVAQRLQRQVPVTILFQYPTVRTLAEYLTQGADLTDHLSRSKARGSARRRGVRQRNVRTINAGPDG
jgi:acyl carrier protein